MCLFCFPAGNVEAEMLHTYIKVDPLDQLILSVRLAVLLAVTLTVPVVLFPVRDGPSLSPKCHAEGLFLPAVLGNRALIQSTFLSFLW